MPLMTSMDVDGALFTEEGSAASANDSVAIIPTNRQQQIPCRISLLPLQTYPRHTVEESVPGSTSKHNENVHGRRDRLRVEERLVSPTGFEPVLLP